MLEPLLPYSEYKDSDHSCFGQIPKHWKVLRNGQIFSQRNQTGFPDLPILEVSLKTGVRVRDFENSKRKQVMNNREQYKRAGKGDIAYNMMRMWQGAVGVAPVDGLVSPAYVVASPLPEVESRYYSYLFRTHTYMNEVNKYSHGIVADRNRLYWDEFKQIPSLFPPSNEQKKIADFLDDHGRNVSRLVRIKRRQIELLRELKQAFINEAVTKGLNPNVRMKPSGIDWIGDIPEHWGIRVLRQLLKPVSVKNRTDLPLLSVVREKGVILRSDMSVEENHNYIPDDLSGYKVVEMGQFVMNKMKAWQGSFGVSSLTGIVSPAYYIFNLDFSNKEYFHYAIRSKVYVNFFGQASDGIRIGQWDLSLSKLKVIPFLIPPEEEQNEILQYIPKKLDEMENLVIKLQQEIDLITEYRTRLISDVVTGKVDIRDIAVEDVEEETIEWDIEESAEDNEEVVDFEECEV